MIGIFSCELQFLGTRASSSMEFHNPFGATQNEVLIEELGEEEEVEVPKIKIGVCAMNKKVCGCSFVWTCFQPCLPMVQYPTLTTYWPHTTTYWPHTNHILTTYQPHVNHIPSTYQPHVNNNYVDHNTTIMSTTYRPHTNHMSTTCWPHTNHMSTTCWPHINHVTDRILTEHDRYCSRAENMQEMNVWLFL